MNKIDYINYHNSFCEKMMNITKRKNDDYTGGSDDPFANFRSVGLLNVCDVETGFLVRLSDKFSRLNSFVKRGTFSVNDESLEDTCIDIANYAALFVAYVISEKAKISTPDLHRSYADSSVADEIRQTEDLHSVKVDWDKIRWNPK